MVKRSRRNSGSMPAIVPAIVFSLLIGGVGGYFVRMYSVTGPAGPSPANPYAQAGQRGGGGGAPGGMSSGGMMGGGQPSAGMMLPRMVRNLVIVQTVQNKGITAEQAKALLPILQQLKAADKLPDKDAQARLDDIQKVLNDPQKEALAAMTPQRGGGGGRPGGGPGMTSAGMTGGGRPGGGAPGAMMGSAGPMGGGGAPGGMGSGGMMGGGRPDPERPFAGERNKKALDDLIALLEPQAK